MKKIKLSALSLAIVMTAFQFKALSTGNSNLDVPGTFFEEYLSYEDFM
jgi:hypothetical protein